MYSGTHKTVRRTEIKKPSVLLLFRRAMIQSSCLHETIPIKLLKDVSEKHGNHKLYDQLDRTPGCHIPDRTVSPVFFHFLFPFFCPLTIFVTYGIIIIPRKNAMIFSANSKEIPLHTPPEDLFSAFRSPLFILPVCLRVKGDIRLVFLSRSLV